MTAAQLTFYCCCCRCCSFFFLLLFLLPFFLLLLLHNLLLISFYLISFSFFSVKFFSFLLLLFTFFPPRCYFLFQLVSSPPLPPDPPLSVNGRSHPSLHALTLTNNSDRTTVRSVTQTTFEAVVCNGHNNDGGTSYFYCC